MSRSGYYEDDCGDVDSILRMGRWRAQVKSATRGRRGQLFFRELVEALEAMPEKKLIADELQTPTGEVCAIGALGVKRGVDMTALDPEEAEGVAEAFGIAHQLAREVVYVNDEDCRYSTPEERWERVHRWAKSQLKEADRVSVG